MGPGAAILLLLSATLYAVAATPPRPTFFLHLSDIHVANTAELNWAKFGDREGDLRTLTTAVVRPLAPAAIVITGDLVDSKDARGAGARFEQEWRGYKAFLEHLESAGGVPTAAVLDTRGNHDGFNRGAARGNETRGDLFAHYSATGLRGESEDKVWVHAVGSDGRLAALPAAVAAGGCPSVAFLGVDFSEDPGFKNPLNFLGHSNAELVAAVAGAAADVAAAWPAGCPSPPALVSYGHYPLSFVDVHPSGPWAVAAGPWGSAAHAAHPLRSLQGAAEALVAGGAAAYFSGHLHTEFGERMHRAHSLEATKREKISGNADTTISSQVMVELETGAWKDDRRIRVCAIDGGVLSFVDLYFHTPTAPARPKRSDVSQLAAPGWQDRRRARGWGITVASRDDGVVLDHVAMLTWPPDARYSLQPAAAAAAGAAPPFDDGTVRAAVLSLDAEDISDFMEVAVEVFLPGSNALMARERLTRVSADGAAAAAGPVLFQGRFEVEMPCKRRSCADPPSRFVEVTVTAGSGSGESRSARAVCALRCSPAVNAGCQRCWLAPSLETAPMGSKVLEWMVLALNWPVVLHWTFLSSWTAHAALLIALPLTLSRSQARVARLARACATRPGGLLTWPARALVLAAAVPGLWPALAAYSLYIQLGPLYFGELLDEQPAAVPPAAVFAYGVIGRFHGQSLQFVPTPDTFVVATGQMIGCIIPLTLWVACVVGRHVVAAAAGRPAAAVSVREAAVLVAVVGFNWLQVWRKMWIFYGPLTVLASPGGAWAMPAAVVAAAVGARAARRVPGLAGGKDH